MVTKEVNAQPRWCTNCQTKQPIAGGKQIKFANGLRQRWICAQCAQRRKERKNGT